MSGLYVHLPWCVRKCPYCDFNSHPLKARLPESDYLSALLKDFRGERPRAPWPIRSVYFGGGTPSLFSPRAFARLLDAFALPDDVEVTMEANPGTIETAGAIAEYARAGINRVSLGVQSFDDRQLRALGRIHDGDEARRAARAIRAAGFRGFNIDLMFGLSGQTVAGALADLEGAVTLAPDHISWYQLTIEPRTEFARRPPELPGPDALADIAEAGQAFLAEHGYERYEVSAYARPGSRCRHNLNYWTFGDYLGIGAGAHGKLTGARGIVRTAKARQPRLYLKDPSPVDTPVDPGALPVEFMMNALRLVDGVPASRFEERAGLSGAVIDEVVTGLREEGLMDPDRLALTQFGYRHLDTVVARFL
ncbi:MAG: radical SAM family heme chaperone HemW [Gammaproteobacteria bacterium]|nr:radical SAM family heme chaperone HemW [Gammaproteobacteria bacterium]